MTSARLRLGARRPTGTSASLRPGSGIPASGTVPWGPDARGRHSGTQHAARRRRRDRLAFPRSRRDAAQRRRPRRQATRRRRVLGLPGRARSASTSRCAPPAASHPKPSAACTSPSARDSSGSSPRAAIAARGRARPAASAVPLLPRDRRGALRVADGGAARRARRHDRRARGADGARRVTSPRRTSSCSRPARS